MASAAEPCVPAVPRTPGWSFAGVSSLLDRARLAIARALDPCSCAALRKRLAHTAHLLRARSQATTASPPHPNMLTGTIVRWHSDGEETEDESALPRGTKVDALPVMDVDELQGAFRPKPNHLAEPARSNRSTCCGCQQLIAKGDALRLSFASVRQQGYDRLRLLVPLRLHASVARPARAGLLGAGRSDPEAVLQHCEDRLATRNLDCVQQLALVTRLTRKDRTPIVGKRVRGDEAEGEPAAPAGSEAASSAVFTTPPRKAIKSFAGSPPTLHRKHGLRFSQEWDVLRDLNFVITGFFPELPSALGGKMAGKDYLQRAIEFAGGTVKSSVSGHTSYLIVGRGAGRSKVNKAERYGIPMIDPDGLVELTFGREPDECVPESLSTDFKDEVAFHNLADADAA